MTQPEISVIIPVYNVEALLPRCVDSVLAQTFTDYELILVDDGSTDGSGTACDRYAAKYPNVRALHVPNGGAARARRIGLEHASAGIVTFADSDDSLAPSYLSVLTEAMREGSFDIVTCNYENVLGSVRSDSCARFGRNHVDCASFGDVVRMAVRDRSLLLGPVCKLFRKDLFDGVDFYDGAAIGEDYCMCVEVFRKASRVRCLDVVLYSRFIQEGSVSHSGYTAGHAAGVRNYRRMNEELSGEFPELEPYITGYHVQYELAAVTAMGRNLAVDRGVLSVIRSDIGRNLCTLLGIGQIPPAFKVSMLLILASPMLFIRLFHAFYLMERLSMERLSSLPLASLLFVRKG